MHILVHQTCQYPETSSYSHQLQLHHRLPYPYSQIVPDSNIKIKLFSGSTIILVITVLIIIFVGCSEIHWQGTTCCIFLDHITPTSWHAVIIVAITIIMTYHHQHHHHHHRHQQQQQKQHLWLIWTISGHQHETLPSSSNSDLDKPSKGLIQSQNLWWWSSWPRWWWWSWPWWWWSSISMEE